jgi:NAD(P)-dependent dehydrogenase (short-subunit alcohol dehydrogenase family)
MTEEALNPNGGGLPAGVVGRGAIVITGASTGIGAAAALRMDQRGYRVFAGVRRDEDGERLRAMATDRLTPLMIDVTHQRSIDDAAAVVEEATGRHGLAGLVNNAGIAVTGPVEYLQLDRYRQQFEINYFGQIAVTQAFMPAIRRGAGRVVFMGSIAGRVSAPFLSPYAGTKHALEALTDSMRVEMAPWDIKVSVIEPGAIKTPIWDKGLKVADEVLDESPEEAVRLYEPFIEPVRSYAREQNEAGADVSKVSDVVEHALTAKRPKTRYLVGRDARIQALAKKWLPDSFVDRLTRQQLGLPKSLPRQ